MAWRLDEILEALRADLAAGEADLVAEQATHGLDALSEVSLHPVLARGLERAGWAVFRECPYPGQAQELPKESERLRCDLVLAPAGASAIGDSVRTRKELRKAEGTLFAGVATEMLETPAGTVPPDEALWLEVKTIGQHTYVDGYAGPNRSYASQFQGCMADIRKLAGAVSVGHAVMVLVLFSASEAVASHDLAAFMHKCLDRDLPVAELRHASVAIADRIGNAACTVGLIRVRSGD